MLEAGLLDGWINVVAAALGGVALAFAIHRAPWARVARRSRTPVGLVRIDGTAAGGVGDEGRHHAGTLGALPADDGADAAARLAPGGRGRRAGAGAVVPPRARRLEPLRRQPAVHGGRAGHRSRPGCTSRCTRACRTTTSSISSSPRSWARRWPSTSPGWSAWPCSPASGTLDAAHVGPEYFAILPLMSFGEGVVNGMLVGMAVVYRPRVGDELRRPAVSRADAADGQGCATSGCGGWQSLIAQSWIEAPCLRTITTVPPTAAPSRSATRWPSRSRPGANSAAGQAFRSTARRAKAKVEKLIGASGVVHAGSLGSGYERPCDTGPCGGGGCGGGGCAF